MTLRHGTETGAVGPRGDVGFAGGGGLAAVPVGTVVCGREVVAVLPGGRSLLAREIGDGLRTGEQGRVVLKPIPRDCLAGGGELRPMVKDRLARVRELAEVRVASLRGVEQDGVLGAMMVWDWVPGLDLPAAFEGTGTDGGFAERLMELSRNFVAAVERIHALGIVHGAIHLRNIIVTQDSARAGWTAGELVLTHVSPLVVDDVRRDTADVLKVLRELNARSRSAASGEHAVLSRIIAECSDETELATLRQKLLQAEGARFVRGRTTATDVAGGREPAGKAAFWSAVALAALAACASAAIAWWAMGMPGAGLGGVAGGGGGGAGR